MGIKSYIVNFLKFLKHGGVKYVSVTFTNPDARYTNKKVFISGGSEGLGRAMAKAYIAEHYKVRAKKLRAKTMIKRLKK